MAVRNLTPHFLRLRESNRPINSTRSSAFGERDPFRPGGGEVTINMNPPLWMERSAQLQELNEKIREQLKILTDLHKAQLKPAFGRDQAAEHARIEEQAAEIAGLFKEAEGLMKDLQTQSSAKLQEGETLDERTVLENVRIAMATELMAASRTFREEQRKYMEHLKRDKERQRRIAQVGGGPVEDEEPETEQRKERQLELLDQGFSPEQIEDLMLAEKLQSERDQGLQAIYRGLVDLHEMFRDINALVIDQGTMLDRIDANIGKTQVAVEQGNKHLAETIEIQKKSKFAMIVMILILAIAAAVLLLFIKIIF